MVLLQQTVVPSISMLSNNNHDFFCVGVMYSGEYDIEFHIVCAHMYFLWRHHFPPDKSENDQDNDSIDLHIVLTYDC
jgi:hypothetical protein